MNIEDLRVKAIKEIEIPGFDVTDDPITIKVQRPRLMAMATQGKIPNALMGIATKMINGPKGKGNTEKEEDKLIETGQMIELYCRACMISPTYEEMQDIITDEQMMAIFDWAVGRVQKLSTFRTDKENGPNNSDGQGVSVPAK